MALVIVALLVGCTASEAPPAKPFPDSMAVIGDSIALAVNSDAPGARPAHSFATGSDAADGFESVAERLALLNPTLAPNTKNFAESGGKMDSFARQARDAAAARSEFVVVLLGANDVCARGGPTSLENFSSDFREGAEVLRAAGAKVLVLSIPDITKLREVGANDSSLQARWALTRACPAILQSGANDALIPQYNAILRDETEAFGFSFDDDAVFDGAIVREDVSNVDGFHPSVRGQAKLADAVWLASRYAS